MYYSFHLKSIVIISCVAILLTTSPSGSAQPNQALSVAEENLKALSDTINSFFDDNDRINYGVEFSSMLHNALTLDGSFEHPFSLLPNLSKLTSSDKLVRIYTWNIPLHSGMNMFYGIVQLNPAVTDTQVVIDLVDHFSEISIPEEEILSSGKWYGAIYSKVIDQQTVHGQKFYTLLGWRGMNMLMTSRLIDILTITSEGGISFGKPVFCNYLDTKPSRIVFTHSANVTMSLRYEEQSVVIDKQWNKRRKEFIYSREKTWMIVCDRLIPSNPELEGQYEYYVPDGDIMDGLFFKDGCWNFIEQIDARNP